MICRRVAAFAFGLVGLSLALGCGTQDPLKRQALSGTVSLDGTPVEQGSISFQPTNQGQTQSGAVVTKGKYTVPKDKGLPAGTYRVVINAIAPGSGGELPEGGMPGDPLPSAKELIPPEWNIKSKNSIEVTNGGANTFNFDISSTKK